MLLKIRINFENGQIGPQRMDPHDAYRAEGVLSVWITQALAYVEIGPPDVSNRLGIFQVARAYYLTVIQKS